MDPERRVLRGHINGKMRGSPHISAPLASHPPASTPRRRSVAAAETDSTARKRNYNMREMQLGGEQPPEDIDDSPREPKRTRPSPEGPTANGSARSKLSKRLSLESGNGGGSVRSKMSRRSAKSPRGTPRGNSRFVEGSMRDRESQRPPQEFVTDAAESTFSITKETPSTAGERPRSGVFRFGRALANAFNPSFVWQGVFSNEKSASPSKEEPDDRKVKAEKAYAELKRAGLLGTRRESIGSSNRDSGTDLDYRTSDYRTSDERKRDGRVYEPSEDQKRNGLVFDTALSTPLGTVTPSDTSQPMTPETDVPSDLSRGNKRRSSLQALHRMKSHFSLKGIRRENISPPRAPSAEGRDSTYRIGKKISKKEVARQQKLTKRISNLESQLDRARRELQDTLNQPDTLGSNPNKATEEDLSLATDMPTREESPQTHDEMTDEDDEDMASPVMSPPSLVLPPPQEAPYRRRFVPGALPSLPSERLLLPPERPLPTTPDGSPSNDASPGTISRVIQGTVSMELNSSPMKAKTMTRSDALAPGVSMEGSLPAGRKRKPSIQITRKPVPQVEESVDKKVKYNASADGSTPDQDLPRAKEGPMDATVGDRSSPDASPLPPAQNIVPGISTSDLRSLYQASAHAKRLRAIGPASPPRRRVSGNSMGRGTIVPERRSISPRSRRVRAAAKQRPVTATPGTGDRRGEIVPPLPRKKGVTDVSSGSGKENRDRATAWEGWGDDVF